MSIKSLVDKVVNIKDCIVYPPSGMPNIPYGYTLPNDIKEFYTICGGIDLNTAEFFYGILPPEKFLIANPIILGGDYLVIDLNKNRCGLCYEGFHETYGLVGDMPIIAGSFTELLKNLIENAGMNIYWKEDNFQSLGDAYDNIEVRQ